MGRSDTFTAFRWSDSQPASPSVLAV